MNSPIIQQIISNNKIILGLSGGIAIYKACELVRLLTTNNAQVHSVMTINATKMISPSVFEALTGNLVWFDQWQQNQAGKMEHLNLTRGASALLIAPATANIIAKIANGLADDLLSTLIVAREQTTPLILAPAMNTQMWNNSTVQSNIKKCRENNINILNPQFGELACNEIGQGRLIEAKDLLLLTTKIINTRKQKKIIGKKILITLGPTYEKIDPIRGITNLSSGKMGMALAKVAWLSGADIYVIAAGGIKPFITIDNLQTNNLHWQNVVSAKEMHDQVMNITSKVVFDGFFSVAAIADYQPVDYQKNKIKKHPGIKNLNLKLIPTDDVLSKVGHLIKNRPKTVIGFAAETEKLILNAKIKLINKSLDYIIVNNVKNAFASDNNQATILSANSSNTHKIKTSHKELVASEILYRTLL